MASHAKPGASPKIIILGFDDRAHFAIWAESPEYQKISTDRIAATDGVVLVVNGVSQ